MSVQHEQQEPIKYIFYSETPIPEIQSALKAIH